jgi:hypothetical protein
VAPRAVAGEGKSAPRLTTTTTDRAPLLQIVKKN